MANSLYDTFEEDLLKGLHDLTTNSIKAILGDAADYTFDHAHRELSDVPAAARVATSDALANVTVTNGDVDSDDFTWGTVTGDQAEQIILFSDKSSDERLIAYFDTSITGMPVTPNGGDINVTVGQSGWWTRGS